MFLLDTNVISELRRPRPHGAVLAWISSHSADQLFVSAVTAGEIQSGIVATRARDPHKAREIEDWLGRALENFTFLPMHVREFRRWATLMAGRPHALAQDGMIAATALESGLVVATRDLSDFIPFNVATFNPFEDDRGR